MKFLIVSGKWLYLPIPTVWTCFGSFRFKDRFSRHWVRSAGRRAAEPVTVLVSACIPSPYQAAALMITFYSTRQRKLFPNMIDSYLSIGFTQCRANRSLNGKDSMFFSYLIYICPSQRAKHFFPKCPVPDRRSCTASKQVWQSLKIKSMLYVF